jgi:hypothetical protein
MATMTSQQGRYFMFEVIELKKKVGYPHFVFHKIISIGILNYYSNFKKIL